jgi:hypothetical protein
MNTWILKAALVLTFIAAICASTWFAAKEHYSAQFTVLKAGYDQAARDAKATQDKIKQDNEKVTKEINDEAQSQISDMVRAIGDLSVRLRASGGRPLPLCPAAPSSPVADANPNRPGTSAGDRQLDHPAGHDDEGDEAGARAIFLQAFVVGIESLKSNQLWRKYARETGQAKELQ